MNKYFSYITMLLFLLHGVLMGETVSEKVETLQRSIRQLNYIDDGYQNYLNKQIEIINNLRKYREADKQQKRMDDVELESAQIHLLINGLEREIKIIKKNNLWAQSKSLRKINVKDLGARGDGKTDDGLIILDAIKKANEIGKGTIVYIPKGIYYIANTYKKFHKFGASITIVKVKNINIIAEKGTVFLFSKVGGGISMLGCHNISVKNIAFNWKQKNLPFTQGTITNINTAKNTCIFKLEPGYSPPDLPRFKNARLMRGLVPLSECPLMTKSSKHPYLNGARHIEKDLYELTTKNKYWKVKDIKTGNRFSIHSRNTPGAADTVFFNESSFITLENCKVFAGYHTAFRIENSDSIKLRRCEARPLYGKGRYACNNADGIWVRNNRRGIWVDRCKIENVNDDLMNIQSQFFRVAEKINDKTYIFAGGILKPFVAIDKSIFIQKNDTFKFVDPNTGSVVTTAKVVSVKYRNWRNSLLKGESAMEITFDKKITGLITLKDLGRDILKTLHYRTRAMKVEHFAVNISTKSAGFYVNGNIFGPGRWRSIILKVGNGIIENNIFNNREVAIKIVGELNWLSGDGAENVVIRNNIFNAPASICSDYYLAGKHEKAKSLNNRRILVYKNKFKNNTSYILSLKYIEDLQFFNNIISYTETPRIITPRIIIDESSNIRVTKNLFDVPDGKTKVILKLGKNTNHIVFGNNKIKEKKSHEF
jgi:Pectate lyase superfamily protein